VAADFERELEDAPPRCATGEDDEETLLNLLRRAHHAETFRTLVRDVEAASASSRWPTTSARWPTACCASPARWCWSACATSTAMNPQFGIIGYGKLGGKELGYGSDLDIVFVFDDDDERAPEIYAAFVRKLINWLTVKTGEGDLFEIDTALRPNGGSGLLVTSSRPTPTTSSSAAATPPGPGSTRP
jgi:glutamate-ammonia-ligase adenylyltransferase